MPADADHGGGKIGRRWMVMWKGVEIATPRFVVVNIPRGAHTKQARWAFRLAPLQALHYIR